MLAAASLSTCALSLARNRLAGCTRSPRSASTRVTGCWASQSICRSGWWRATRRRSRRRAGHGRARSRRRRTAHAGAGRERASGSGAPARAGRGSRRTRATSRVNRTGSRSGIPCPAPGTVTSVPPVRSATRTPASHGTISSRSPCTTSTGHATARHAASASAVPSRARAADVASRVAASVCSAQPTPSSRCLVECGSGNIRAKNDSAHPRWSTRQTGPPDPGNGPRRRPAAPPSRCSTALRASWGRPPPRRRPGRDERPQAAAHGGRPATTPRARPARRRPRPWPRRRRRRTPRPHRPQGRSAGPRRRCPGPRRSPPGIAGPARAPAASTGACG